MARLTNNNKSGYFGIGICSPKTKENIGTLWRSAYQMGASFIFTVGSRVKKQSSDTYCAHRHIPLFEYETVEDFEKNRPYDCQLICVDFGENSVSLPDFTHPKRAIYLLGAEDNGLPNEFKNQKLLSIPSEREPSFNVAMAGTIIMYDRLVKSKK